ncbi:MAG: hypothetical protein IH935_00585 [Acidobacteria bacterium]|nr:hypothetical protein [Acidobacteriota bacterium]
MKSARVTERVTERISERISERQFVNLLRRRAAQHAARLGKSSALRRGIGEDCAVIAASRQKDLLITTDLFLEGVHFRRQWQAAEAVGYKVLARGLSDIAAMGGVPRYAFLSLGLPRRLPAGWLDGFWRGFFRLAAAAKVILAGGDTGASPHAIVADIMVVNKADLPGADQLAGQLQAMVAMAARGRPETPILRTVATRREGIAELANAIEDHRRTLKDSGGFEQQRLERARRQVLASARHRLLADMLAAVEGDGRLDEVVRAVAARQLDPSAAAQRLIDGAADGRG